MFQAPISNRLWAPSQPVTIYVNGTVQNSSGYTIDYPNGVVDFATAPNGTVTASFITNESVPSEVRQATALVAAWLIGQATDNPLGVQSLSVQTYSITFGEDNQTKKRFEMLLGPYSQTLPKFL